MAIPAPLLTMREVAEHFHGSERWLRDWLRDHPPKPGETPYYIQSGRDRLFRPADVARIESHMRDLAAEKIALPAPISRRSPALKSTASQPRCSTGSALEEALRLACERPAREVKAVQKPATGARRAPKGR